MVETPHANLSKGMPRLKDVYTRQFNSRHGLIGHLFQVRFKAILVERDTYLFEPARYLVLNPVRAEMVPHASQWPWNSYRAMVGLDAAPARLETHWVLGQLGTERRKKGMRAFVAEGVGKRASRAVFVIRSSSAAMVSSSASHREPDRMGGARVRRAQRRPLARPLRRYQRIYPDRRCQAMARVFFTGVYLVREITDYFGVH